MKIWESMRIALRSISANKLRAGLTMLGIIIGVMSVIAMLSIGRGTQASITDQITSIGTNLLYVRPGSTQSSGVRTAEGSATTLTKEDATALEDLPYIVGVAPQVESFGQLAYLGNNTNARVLGVTPEYLDAMNTKLASGEFVSSANVTANSAVVVLGSETATTLFDTADPVGQTIRINGQNFRVVGVMETKGGTGFMNADTQVYVPLTTAMTRLARTGQFRGGNTVSVINVKITDMTMQDIVVQEISEVLRERHHIQLTDDFNITSQQDVLDAANQVTGTLTLFLGGVAAISLIVGGIGIMNIMLVSVTERTREIGIRKAVGARRSDILTQFLTEAMILSLAGGLIGVMLGALIARLISGMSIGTSTLNTVVDLDSILLAVLFSAGVGLFFGSYPANRAAGLHPIDALRYE
ncbi:Macrolide export ATP-binding/permease protein MacB [Anaerolineae bacterium]|nr:Macrolide export ATP-binding/permease protein MacB [Anaerolineae bacterium]